MHLPQAQYKFILTHYAGPVPYDTKDFCDKNKDAISADAVALLQTSSDPVASAFFAVAPSAVPEPGVHRCLVCPIIIPSEALLNYIQEAISSSVFKFAEIPLSSQTRARAAEVNASPLFDLACLLPCHLPSGERITFPIHYTFCFTAVTVTGPNSGC